MAEVVNHPEHYGGADNPYEVIKVIEAWDPLMAYHGCMFNVIKYSGRAGKKGPIQEDIGKAAWYAKRAEEILEKYPEVKQSLTGFKTAVLQCTECSKLTNHKVL